MSQIKELYDYMRAIPGDVKQLGGYLPEVRDAYSWDIYYMGISPRDHSESHFERMEVCIFVSETEKREDLETVLAVVGFNVYEYLYANDALIVYPMMVDREHLNAPVFREQSRLDKYERRVFETTFAVIRIPVEFPCEFESV